MLDLIDLPETEKNALFPVGRLDRNTRGVLLITNDGELANRLMHPRYEIEKVYRVRTSRPVKQEDLDRLKKGVDLEDGPAHADEIDFADTGDACDVVLLIHEGRNRQVRRMFEQIGHEVGALERVSYAGLTTQGVRRGKWRRLYPHEIRRLRSLVKLK